MEAQASDARPQRPSVSPPSAWDAATWAGLVEVLREDRRTYQGGPLHPGQHVMLVHRLGVWSNHPARRRVTRVVLGGLCHLTNTLYIRNILGFEISHLTRIGRRVRFVHQGGVVIQPNAEIGDDSMIFHGVTIGRRWEESHDDLQDPPRIGCRVQIGVGAVIIGPVLVGDDAKVGPNAVVTSDVPAGASAVAPASRTLRLR